MASQARFNHTAPCAVKRAGVADGIGAGSSQPTGAAAVEKAEEKNRRTPRAVRIKESGGNNPIPPQVSGLGGELSVSRRDPVRPRAGRNFSGD